MKMIRQRVEEVNLVRKEEGDDNFVKDSDFQAN